MKIRERAMMNLALPIQQTLILDVGCAYNPHGNVNVEIDRTRFTSRKYASYEVKNPLIADVCKLPFPDNSFSLVYSRNVLEHLDNPTRALNELIRVAQHEIFIIIPHRFAFRKHPKGHKQFFGILALKRWLYDTIGFLPIIHIAYRYIPFDWLPILRLPARIEIRIIKTRGLLE